MSRGRTYCNAVESYDCEAPAGYRTARGFASLPGVKVSDLHECAYCDNRVCTACSSTMEPPAFLARSGPVRVCLTHSAEELADWLGLPEMQVNR